MSTTITKRNHAEALADAMAIQALFPRHTYKRFMLGGSLRRKRPEVGDVEIIVEPAFEDRPSEKSLFGEPIRINLFWDHLDSLIPAGLVQKHIYGATGFRWGEKYRGIEWRGQTFEFFTADDLNWGAQLCIRTGPAEFSKAMVTALYRSTRRMKDGYVWDCQPCGVCRRDEPRNEKCSLCQGTTLEPLRKVPVPDEATFFKLCGRAVIAPEARQ